ncbi:DUF7344 domain-containing protein [Natrialbaceae archaeon AArc-T1-2]|uniref:DUF7344 domain-containing protein n=1 Tax=Natrialbaceae archaeon AArc-T1-2 TaxID=3053904 RepID=UPI00255A7F65|nr:hypothetical protein [Natrialbaceae archaeon AArc-T1-2]WIV66526.1 hypothetical protein QQ977_12605 [Natrialbaceae archaeon AArc-T1-2]
MKKTEAFRVLASADRQLVLHELVERDDGVSVDELSRHVAARRHKITPETVSSSAVERARVRLVHTHLPQLVATDTVDVDWDERRVSLTDDEATAELFEAATELDSWPPDDLLAPPSRSRG